MKFEEVFLDWKNGAKIRRRCWLDNPKLPNYSIRGKGRVFITDDLLADDWEVVEEKPSLENVVGDFAKVLKKKNLLNRSPFTGKEYEEEPRKKKITLWRPEIYKAEVKASGIEIWTEYYNYGGSQWWEKKQDCPFNVISWESKEIEVEE